MAERAEIWGKQRSTDKQGGNNQAQKTKSKSPMNTCVIALRSCKGVMGDDTQGTERRALKQNAVLRLGTANGSNKNGMSKSRGGRAEWSGLL